RIALFVERVEPRRDILVDALADIDGGAPVGPDARLNRGFPDRGPVSLLQRTVHQTAAGAAAEGERAGSFQDFDALHIVQITEDLDVIAEAVDEEVCARVHAANDELVAVAFALVHGDAWNVARDVGQALKALVL